VPLSELVPELDDPDADPRVRASLRLPRPIGGTQKIPDALAERFTRKGGEVITNAKVEMTTSTAAALAESSPRRPRVHGPPSDPHGCDPHQTLTGVARPEHWSRGSSAGRTRSRQTLGWGQLKLDMPAVER